MFYLSYFLYKVAYRLIFVRFKVEIFITHCGLRKKQSVLKMQVLFESSNIAVSEGFEVFDV